MQVIPHKQITSFELPGLIHKTLASTKLGNEEFEVWMQTITGESATPAHKHNCEEVIVILKGKGECLCEGRSFEFETNETLLIPPNAVHQIINTGKEDLNILATLSMSPVVVETAEGSRLTLPWDADESE